MTAFSILSLPLGTALLIYLLSCPTVATAQSYALDTSYSGSTFFNSWSFFTGTDPAHGFVQYLSQSDAQTAGLISQGSGSPAFMGVDHSTTLATTAQGRKSVRITTQKSWTYGLFIANIAHMPDSTCGVWPAFWMFGPDWPSSGEIDMIEGVSRNTENQMSLHTGPNCQMTTGTQSGTVNSLHCDGTKNGNTGCNIASTNPSSYGSVPSDIMSGSPVPSGWGTPQANYVGGIGYNIDMHFMNHSLVFDTTFCGDWAGNVWGDDSVCSGLGNTCVAYVAGHPSAFANSY
ncbi:hypothetical protein BDZ45DRAFT_713211 [Acephala macrosclerotiorum]|nr:hypothetical protein BDZ45DRAFT_713211 [Acephala macrosclerotiorum]